MPWRRLLQLVYLVEWTLFKRGQVEHILTMANLKFKPSPFMPRPIRHFRILLNRNDLHLRVFMMQLDHVFIIMLSVKISQVFECVTSDETEFD